jgi:uncharacterized protein (TIGR03067 family)
MRDMMRWITFGLSLVVLAGASAWGGDDTKKDQEQIQGTWEPTGLSFGGKAFPTPAKNLPTRIFTGDKLTTKDPGKKGEFAVEEATFKLDAAKDPKHIDITQKRDGKTVRGIYLLEGDTLKIAYHLGGEARPTKFDGDGVFVETLKRQAKK